MSLCEKFTDGDWIEAKDQSNSGVRLIQTGNVGLGEYIDKQNNKKWISKETFERLNCEEVFSGDILISRLPEPAGRACIVPNLGTKMITAVDCTIVRTATQVNPKYLLQYLSSQSYFDEVNTCLAGGTRQRISRSNLATFDVSMPVKYEEQKAIGEFLCGMDHLITLHQCNCNMATRPCEWSSGLRAIAWEQRKLGEIADIVGGGTPSTNNPSYWNGDIDWYAPAEIGEQIFLTGSQKKITVLGLQKSSATILPVGSVLFTSRAGIGNTAILAKQGATNQGFQSIVPDSQITDSYFIFSRTHELKKYAEIVGAGSTFTEVSGKQMARMPILMPKIDEQVCIGTFFRNLDRLITLHQRKHILLT